MKKQYILPLSLIIVTLGLTVSAFLILPDNVITQFSVGTSGNTVTPKPVAILIPFALGIGGALPTIFIKENEKSNGKGLLVSVVGIALFVIMIAINSFYK